MSQAAKQSAELPRHDAGLALRFPKGREVRCFFGGGEYRDGPVEFIDYTGHVHVRLSPGWLHTAEPGDLLSIPRGHLLRAGDEVTQ